MTVRGDEGERLARIAARVDWLVSRLEAMDARLVALADRLGRIEPKRPPARARRRAVARNGRPRRSTR